MTVLGSASADAEPSIMRGGGRTTRFTASSDCRAVFCGALVHRSSTPAQSVAVDVHDAAQHSRVIQPWLAVVLGEVRLQTRHLLIRQSKQTVDLSLPKA
jgi:anti-sigma factor RsiW